MKRLLAVVMMAQSLFIGALCGMQQEKKEEEQKTIEISENDYHEIRVKSETLSVKDDHILFDLEIRMSTDFTFSEKYRFNSNAHLKIPVNLLPENANDHFKSNNFLPLVGNIDDVLLPVNENMADRYMIKYEGAFRKDEFERMVEAVRKKNNHELQQNDLQKKVFEIDSKHIDSVLLNAASNYLIKNNYIFIPIKLTMKNDFQIPHGMGFWERPNFKITIASLNEKLKKHDFTTNERCGIEGTIVEFLFKDNTSLSCSEYFIKKEVFFTKTDAERILSFIDDQKKSTEIAKSCMPTIICVSKNEKGEKVAIIQIDHQRTDGYVDMVVDFIAKHQASGEKNLWTVYGSVLGIQNQKIKIDNVCIGFPEEDIAKNFTIASDVQKTEDYQLFSETQAYSDFSNKKFEFSACSEGKKGFYLLVRGPSYTAVSTLVDSQVVDAYVGFDQQKKPLYLLRFKYTDKGHQKSVIVEVNKDTYDYYNHNSWKRFIFAGVSTVVVIGLIGYYALFRAKK